MQMKRGTYSIVVPVALAALFLPARCVLAQRTHAAFIRFVMPGSGHGLMAAGGRFGGPSGSSQGYLGIGFRDVTDDHLATLKLKELHGAEIIHVDHDGPAGQAGLREHDVILQVNGQAIEGEEQLRRVLREIPAGRGVAIVLSRDGQQQTLSAQMADRATVERMAREQRYSVPEPQSEFRGKGFMGGAPIVDPGPPITAPPDPQSHSLIGAVILGSSYTGAALEMIGPQLAQFFGSQGGNGLLVRSVDPRSPADTAGLRAGDVVVRANAVIITGTTEWYRLVRENKGKPLAIVIVRDKQEQTLVLVPDSKKRSCIDRAPTERDSGLEQAQVMNLVPADTN